MKEREFISSRLQEVFLDGKWIANTNYKEQLLSVNWKEATYKADNLNTIAALTFHINYYLSGILNVLNGGELLIHDKYSFNCPEIKSEEEWKNLVNTLIENAEKFIIKTRQMNEKLLDENFTDEKYGSYRRNLEGVIEHSYYHLGQIVLLRKLLKEK